ncbi:hypothetical protein LXL04_021451 [Taraxacum kok-saghyz]
MDGVIKVVKVLSVEQLTFLQSYLEKVNMSACVRSSQPMQTPLVHTVAQTKGAQVEMTRKHEEALKGKKVVEDDLDRVSVHTCPDGESDGEVEAIKIPEKRQTKQLAGKIGLKKSETLAMTKAALEAKKYHEAFEELDFRSPFTDDINETPVPHGLKGPRIRMYDGTGDPDDHVHNFQWAIKMIPMNPKLWSLYFIIKASLFENC